MEGTTLSASQITTYLMCARKYAFRYVERIPPEHQASALSFGSAVHSTLEWFHLERLEGHDPDPAVAVRLFKADWDAEQEKPIRWKDGESFDELAFQGQELVRLYAERYRAITIEAAEVPFEVPLVDPETGEILPERLRGYFDLLLPDDQLIEIKTAAKRFDQNTLKRKIQLSAYSYAYREKWRRDPSLVVVTLLKTRKPAIDVIATQRSQEDDAFFVHLAGNVAKGIDAHAFPPNPGWLCSDCEYARACGAWRGNTATSELTRALFEPLLNPAAAMSDSA